LVLPKGHRKAWLAQAQERLGTVDPFAEELTVERGLEICYDQLLSSYGLHGQVEIFDDALEFFRKTRIKLERQGTLRLVK